MIDRQTDRATVLARISVATHQSTRSWSTWSTCAFWYRAVRAHLMQTQGSSRATWLDSRQTAVCSVWHASSEAQSRTLQELHNCMLLLASVAQPSVSPPATPCSSDLHRVHMCSQVFGDLGGSKQGRHYSLPISRSSVKLTTQYTDYIRIEVTTSHRESTHPTLSNKFLSWGYLGIIYLRCYIKYNQLSIINASANMSPGNN